MKTKTQKKAKELLDQLKHLYVVRLGTNTSDYRVRINGEAYVTVGSLYNGGYLEKLKRYAKNNGWTALDLFPAFASGKEYYANTHFVRVRALEQGGEKLKTYLYSSEWDKRYGFEKFDKVISLANTRWPSESEDYRSKEYTLTEAECQGFIDIWEKRKKLIYTNPEDQEPDIETCIRVLKAAGYKIQKPIIQYEEI